MMSAAPPTSAYSNPNANPPPPPLSMAGGPPQQGPSVLQILAMGQERNHAADAVAHHPRIESLIKLGKESEATWLQIGEFLHLVPSLFYGEETNEEFVGVYRSNSGSDGRFRSSSWILRKRSSTQCLLSRRSISNRCNLSIEGRVQESCRVFWKSRRDRSRKWRCLGSSW